jgi:hypothetical protein
MVLVPLAPRLDELSFGQDEIKAKRIKTGSACFNVDFHNADCQNADKT